MNVETQIKLNRFQLRDYQIPIADAIENKGYRRVVAILPRRAGKDMTAFYLAIRQCLKRVCVVYYIFPTYSQGRKILWDSITNDGVRILDYIPEELVLSKNSQEMKIRFVNGSLLQIVGSDNYDNLVGTNPSMCIFSEYALQDPRAYQFLRPILTANDGVALFISTPRGKNAFWELYNIALNSDDWFAYKLSVLDTGHISLEEIEKERAEGLMSEDLIQQEYFCFPGGQEVLCHDSVKRIDQVKPEDLVVTHAGRVRKVKSVISRDYCGPLIEIISFGSPEPIRCTPNHPVRVYCQENQTYSWKPACKIEITDLLVFPKYQFCENNLLSRSLCLLMAWYITEGSSFKNGIQFTLGKQEEVDRVVELVKDVGFCPIIYKLESGYNVVVNSVQLVDFFRVNCGNKAKTKRIPTSLIAGFEEEFFFELIKGDGCYSIHNSFEKICYSTISKTLAYQVQMLANSLDKGFACGITIRKAGECAFPGNRTHKTQESYSLQISLPALRAKKNSHNWLIRAKHCVAARIKSVSEIEYTGKVYNLSVQYDESYIVAGRAVHNCSFDMGVEGAYYAKYLDKMRINGQVGIIPWENGFKVNTAWDLGMRDSTSIIFFQTIGQTIRIIDYYENSKEGLEHYIKVLESKPYSYGTHIAPHDIMVRELGTGMSRLEKASQLGIDFIVAPNISIIDGIEAARSSFSKIWIDETNCKLFLKALENYRQEYDSKKKIYKSQPLHDFSSHAADAFRYMCLSLPKIKDGASAQELENRYREAMYGSQSNLPPVFRDDYNRY